MPIWQYNVCHTNRIAMKGMDIEEKARKKKELLKGITDTTALAKVAQALSPVDFARKYMWAISNINIDVAKQLGLLGIKKYLRRTRQIKTELNWLHDWILAIATFVRHSLRVYNNKEVTKNMNAK